LDKLDIHNRQRRLELAKNSIRACSASNKNKEAILSFSNYCFAEGLSVDRVEHYLRIFRKILEVFPKDFESANRKDIVELVRSARCHRGNFLNDFAYW